MRSLLQDIGLASPPVDIFGTDPQQVVPASRNHARTNNIIIVVVAVVAAMALTTLLVTFMYFCHIRRKGRGSAYQRRESLLFLCVCLTVCPSIELQMLIFRGQLERSCPTYVLAGLLD